MEDVFICDYIRTPIGRLGGSLSLIRADDLASITIKGLVDRNKEIDWASVSEVVLGCANQSGEDNRNVARMALLLAGLPLEVPGTTINRLCGSGMDAVITAYRILSTGAGDLAIAGGVESMSRAPFVIPKATRAFSRNSQIEDTTMGWRFINPKMDSLYGTDSMPQTAENVAEAYGISRIDQDKFAFESQQKAAAAKYNNFFSGEIIPVEVKNHKGISSFVSEDEHPRETSLEKLSSLPTPFKNGGTVTPGNASGLNDGSAALLLATYQGMIRHGLTPLARILGGSTAGVEPRLMGMGPVPATRKLINRLKLNINRFDVVEINEAFASQSLAVIRELGLPDNAESINKCGGAISLGHPLGMSGARITGTACRLLSKEGNLALATMCIGVGQGISIALERP
ncbi:3-oxoadipyl-CoA thiolase [Litoricolaceae bacterium]|nr:3-oxoadipyl-CoA thiolase [Litorivicinaceae bacterium]